MSPVCCPHQASRLPWCLRPTLPFKADAVTVAQGASCSLCLGFAWSPTCPAPLISRPHLPDPEPCTPLPTPLSTICSGVPTLEQGSPVITPGALCLPPALRKCHYMSHLSFLISISHQSPGSRATSQAPLLLLSRGPHAHLSCLHFATSQRTFKHNLVHVPRSAGTQSRGPPAPSLPSIKTMRSPGGWVGLPAARTCPPQRTPVGSGGPDSLTRLSSI